MSWLYNEIANVSRYCENTEKEAKRLLAKAKRNDVMLFLEWILDNYPSRKRISLRQKFKHWRQFFRKIVGQRWRDDWREEVNDVSQMQPHMQGSSLLILA
jgi:hypothetical protein